MLVILMRGLPGSGKTTLVRHLAELGRSAGRMVEICSADHFFEQRLGGHFDPTRLKEAHDWCFDSFKRAVEARFPLVFVDNTNIERRHMERYIDVAHDAGYSVATMAPETPWANNPERCAEHTVHGVPVHTIKRMAGQFTP